MQFDSLFDMMQVFSDEQRCINYLRSVRWADGASCPHCGSAKVYHFSDNKTHKCGDCRKRFSIKVGTIFEDSKIALQKWFMAIYLVASHKKGVSSLQLAKDIGVTQKTAWFMLHRLRHAAQTKSFNKPLEGIVEVDETYVGGKEANKHKGKRTKGTQGRSTKTKSVVFGMQERDGDLRANYVPDAKTKTLRPIIAENIAEDAIVMSDEYLAYNGLDSTHVHFSVNHGKGQYAIGAIHTNTIEGFWSHFKRSVNGIHHWDSKKHMDRYVQAAVYRWNTRLQSEGQRVTCFLGDVEGRLTWKGLTS